MGKQRSRQLQDGRGFIKDGRFVWLHEIKHKRKQAWSFISKNYGVVQELRF